LSLGGPTVWCERTVVFFQVNKIRKK
jgi:hypothetical protein